MASTPTRPRDVILATRVNKRCNALMTAIDELVRENETMGLGQAQTCIYYLVSQVADLAAMGIATKRRK